MSGSEAYYRAYASGHGLNRAFLNFLKRDQGIARNMKVIDLLHEERSNVAGYSANEQMRRLEGSIDEASHSIELQIGKTIEQLHRRKLAELLEQREQANYLKVEIITGEKELIEGQKGLPPRRVVDIEKTVAPGYRYWPFTGEYWEDELGTYIFTTESSCVN